MTLEEPRPAHAYTDRVADTTWPSHVPRERDLVAGLVSLYFQSLPGLPNAAERDWLQSKDFTWSGPPMGFFRRSKSWRTSTTFWSTSEVTALPADEGPGSPHALKWMPPYGEIVMRQPLPESAAARLRA